MIVKVLRLSALWIFPHLFIKESCPWSSCTWIITVNNKLVSHICKNNCLLLLIIAVLNCIVETNWRGSGASRVPIKPQPPKIQSQQYLTLHPLFLHDLIFSWKTSAHWSGSASKECREQLSLPNRWGTTCPSCCRKHLCPLERFLPVPWPLLFCLARHHSSIANAFGRMRWCCFL